MTNDLDEFVDDILHNMVDSNVAHAKAYDDITVDDYIEVREKHDYTIVIGVDVGRDEPSLYEEFVNSLTPVQQLTFHEILELIRGDNVEE